MKDMGTNIMRAAGLLSVGCAPVDVGVVPVPALMLHVREAGAFGGISVGGWWSGAAGGVAAAEGAGPGGGEVDVEGAGARGAVEVAVLACTGVDVVQVCSPLFNSPDQSGRPRDGTTGTPRRQ